jgi:Tol biopolymer transport system component
MDGGAATGAPQLVYPGEAIYPAAWTAAGGLYLRLYTTVTLAQQVAVDPQTGVPVRVEELPQAIPLAGLFAWSPDRQRIAFNGYDGDRMILRILAVGQNSTTSYSLFAPGERLWRMYWSADGRELHYTSMRGLRALDPASGQSRVVVDQGGAGRSVLHQSADGRRTLVSVDVMQPDSTPLGVMVVETGQTRGRLVAPSRSADGLPRSPWVYSQLSPQGDLVLFGRQANLQTGQSSPGAGTLWVVGSDASGLRQLGTVDLIWSAVWAPTGRFIAYTGSSGGRAVARIVDVASGAERDVTLPNPRAEQVIASDWSRDGRLVGLVTSESRYGFWVLQRLLDHPR